MINLALLWPKFGGTGTSLNDLVLGLDKQRFNAIFIYLSGYGVDKNLIEEAGYEVFYLSNIEFINAFRFSILFRLVRILKEHNVDIIHCHRHKPSFYGTLAAKIAGVPVIFSHVHGLNRSKNPRRKFINWIILRWVTKIVAVSKAVKEDVLRDNPTVRPEQVILIRNSIDYDRFADVQITKEQAKQNIGLKANSFVFGTVGRLAHTKGQTYLIKAFVKIKQTLPSAHLIFIGEGPLRNQLEAQAAKASPDSIHFLGRRDDVPELLRAMDVFVFPSIAEGFGLALAEAMAAGVPCIATEVGGMPEIINGEDVGLLVPPGDPEALAKAMIGIANMPEQELKCLIEKAKERIRTNFNHDVVIKKLENIYETEYEIAYSNK